MVHCKNKQNIKKFAKNINFDKTDVVSVLSTSILAKNDDAIQPPRALDRRCQKDWARDAENALGFSRALGYILGPWAKYEFTLLCKY